MGRPAPSKRRCVALAYCRKRVVEPAITKHYGRTPSSPTCRNIWAYFEINDAQPNLTTAPFDQFLQEAMISHYRLKLASSAKDVDVQMLHVNAEHLRKCVDVPPSTLSLCDATRAVVAPFACQQ